MEAADTAAVAGETVLALEEDRYAHGGTQLAVGHHGDELMP